MIAEHAGEEDSLERRDVPDCKLRNWIIIANAAAWILIIVLIRLIFF